MGMPTEPLLDIMRRTMTNLEFVERHAGPEGPYEVTQLINSFLGALAHPWEAMRDDLMNLPLAEAERRGWPRIVKERPADKEPKGLGDLVRLLRNGMAHGNIDFLPSAKREIQALRIWNTHPQSGKRTWGAVITIADAKTLLELFAQLIEERHNKYGWMKRSA